MTTTPLPTCSLPFHLEPWSRTPWEDGLSLLTQQGIHALSFRLGRFYPGSFGSLNSEEALAWWKKGPTLSTCAMDTGALVMTLKDSNTISLVRALSKAHFLAQCCDHITALAQVIVDVFDRDQNVVISTVRSPERFQLFLLPGAITIASNDIARTHPDHPHTLLAPRAHQLLVVTNAQDSAHAQMAALSNARDFWQAWWTVGTHDNDATTTPLIAPFKPVAAFP